MIENVKALYNEVTHILYGGIDQLDNGLAYLKNHISTMKEINGEKLKSILGIIQNKIELDLNDEFNKKGLSSKADLLLGLAKRIRETKEAI